MIETRDDPTRLAQMIDTAERVVAFTGAGISTESGIPDFRSPGGVWSKMKPIQFQDYIASDEVRQEAWRRRFTGDRAMERAEPNRGHQAIAQLVEAGKVSAVITQNVDNLHQRAGVPDDQVIELHGNAGYAKCLSCEARYELDALEQEFRETERVGDCARCGGIIKTATISFGQSMPVAEMERAERETLACDLFLSIGSSLVVYPAAGFPELAKRTGAGLVILNREETPLDAVADLVLHREIGETLAFAAGLN